MPTLHMEIIQVREYANYLEAQSEDIYSKINNLKNCSNRLSMSWNGSGQPEAFQRDLVTWVNQSTEKAEELHNLSIRVNREADKWEGVDSTWQNFWKSISFFILGAPVAAGGFDWTTFFNSGGLGTIYDVIGIADKIGFDNIGRDLNKLLGETGWISQMSSLGKILDNPAISLGIPMVFGVLSDIRDGETFEHAVESQAATTLIDAGIGAIPIVGEIYAGYKLGIGIGNLIAGGLELAGDTTDAVWLQNTLDTLDFSDELGDEITDWLNNV